MAKRKQVANGPETREEVDVVLARLAVLDADRRRLLADLDEQVTALRENAQGRLDTLAAEDKALRAQVKVYAVAHRTEFGDKKSLELVHAVLSFRTSPPSVRLLNNKWTAETVIPALKAWRARYIRVVVALNKERILADHAAGKVTDTELAERGVKVAQTETFGIELKQEEDGRD